MTALGVVGGALLLAAAIAMLLYLRRALRPISSLGEAPTSADPADLPGPVDLPAPRAD
ncbi:MAG: hypothetical protein JWN72_83 [Thermoleophilia bacterium]|nr:hypothetical protein [Thermoleophilia bacterium]